MARGASAIAGLANLALGGQQAKLDTQRLAMELERDRFERELQREAMSEENRRAREAQKERSAAALNQMIQQLAGAGVGAIGEIGGLVERGEAKAKEQTRYEAEQARLADETQYSRGQDTLENQRKNAIDKRADLESTRAGLPDVARAALDRLGANAGLPSDQPKQVEVPSEDPLAKVAEAAKPPAAKDVATKVREKAPILQTMEEIYGPGKEQREVKEQIKDAAVEVSAASVVSEKAANITLDQVVADTVARNPKLKGLEDELRGQIVALQDSKRVQAMGEKRAAEKHKLEQEKGAQELDLNPKELESLDKSRKSAAALGWAEQKERERHNRALEAKAAAAAQAAADKADKPKPPSSATNRALSGYDSKIALLEELLRDADSVNTGKLDTLINKAAQELGLDDEKTTKYIADQSGLVNETISDLGGATVPPGEMARLKEGLPMSNDQDSVRKQKLKSTIERLKSARKYLEEREGLAPSAEVIGSDDAREFAED